MLPQRLERRELERQRVRRLEAGVAPPVVLESTHTLALEFSSLESLREHAAED